MDRASDFVRVVELIRLAAQEAKAFGDVEAAVSPRIARIVERIEAAADELEEAALVLDKDLHG